MPLPTAAKQKEEIEDEAQFITQYMAEEEFPEQVAQYSGRGPATTDHTMLPYIYLYVILY